MVTFKRSCTARDQEGARGSSRRLGDGCAGDLETRRGEAAPETGNASLLRHPKLWRCKGLAGLEVIGSRMKAAEDSPLKPFCCTHSVAYPLTATRTNSWETLFCSEKLHRERSRCYSPFHNKAALSSGHQPWVSPPQSHLFPRDPKGRSSTPRSLSAGQRVVSRWMERWRWEPTG